MTWWARFRRRAALDRDLDRELQDHLERRTQALIAAGQTPTQARRRLAGGDQRLGAALEMILQLAIEIAIERGAAAEASEPGHGRPPAGRRISPMAAARRSQLAVPLSGQPGRRR